jgi:N-acetylmuramoyl-L-alanine amidase
MRWTSGLQLAAAASGLLLIPALSRHTAPVLLAVQATQAVSTPTPQSSPQPPVGTEAQKPAAPEFFVMIDPSHGGDDRGATLPGKVQEKDLTLTLARELRRQLEELGIHARLLRENDVNLSLEKRAETTNAEHAAMYVALHAALPGKGVRVYSAVIPSPSLSPSPAGTEKFLPWDRAQTTALDKSRALAHAVSDELRKAELPVSLLTSPLRPLNNVAVPAISLEWAPEAGDLKPQQSAKAVAKLTSAVASGIVQVRGPSGVRP